MTPILGAATCSAEDARQWSRSKGAPDWWANLTDVYWEVSRRCGVRPDVGFAQACKESGFGYAHTGPDSVLDPSFCNPAGIKTAAGGGNYDPDAHYRFPDWAAGIADHMYRLWRYATPAHIPTPDGWTSVRPVPTRYWGTASAVEDLSGKWAPSLTYHTSIVRSLEEMTAMAAPRYGIWKPLPEHASQPKIRPTQMIAHSIVGSARGAYNYFANSTSIESHWIMTKAGEVWQLMESDRRADANYKANRWSNGTGALSMETEDNGNPDRDPWTHAQVQGLIDWFRWGHETFGIPLHLPDSPAAWGIGYHTLFPNHWTNVPGKTCPGIVRKEQFYDLILPALATPTTPDQEDDDMGWTSLIHAAFDAKHPNGLTAEHKAKVWFWGDVLARKAVAGDNPLGAYQWIKANEPDLL